MHCSWEEVLEQPTLGDHIVQVYEDKGFLADAVSRYLSIGSKKKEAGIVIVARRPARRRHRPRGILERDLQAADVLAFLRLPHE